MQNFNIPLPLDLRAILSRNSSVILSADQPAAPSGSQNVTWQTDEFGNLSASVPPVSSVALSGLVFPPDPVSGGLGSTLSTGVTVGVPGLVWSARQNTTAPGVQDMAFIINNTFPITYNNVESYAYHDGVLTINTTVPHGFIAGNSVIFYGYTGGLAPINYNPLLNQYTTAYSVLETGLTDTSFQISETLVTSDGTDLSGTVSLFPQVSGYAVTNGDPDQNSNVGNSCGYLFVAGQGMRFEINSPGTSPPTAPGQMGYLFVDSNFNIGMWIDLFDGSIWNEGPSTAPYTKAGMVYSVAGTPLPAAATVGVARAFVSDASANDYGTAYSGSGGITAPVYSDGTSWYMG